MLTSLSFRSESTGIGSMAATFFVNLIILLKELPWGEVVIEALHIFVKQSLGHGAVTDVTAKR